MKWIKVLIDDDKYDELAKIDGGPFRYALAVVDTRAFGLMEWRIAMYELDLEDPREGLTK